jgi:signal transduction histidine kinase
MNPQRDFISESLHALAQPITALRATVELGLRRPPEPQALRQTLEDCLLLVDRLMRELALFREIASLDEQPPLASCDAKALLESCVEEMAPVAQASDIALHLTTEDAHIECHEKTLQRAIFLLLDELIAAAPVSREISLSLRRHEEGYRLDLHPAVPHGLRQKLCQKLLHFAGGFAIGSTSGGISVLFRDGSYQHLPATCLTDTQFLTTH